MTVFLNRMALVSVLLLLASASQLRAQEADVTFFVIGKHASFNQDASGQRTPVDFSFFAEVFLSQGGDASKGIMTLPTGEAVAFVDYRQVEGGERDNILKITGKERYASFVDLQADYPDGEYQISFDTPGGSIQAARLLFRGDSLPQAPEIMLSQEGTTICPVVDPARDLRVTWSPFEQGGPDPEGLIDDLIFVILTDEEGIRLAHSGRPFENKPYLTYSSEEFTIPAGIILQGHTYSLTVEHAILDDTRVYSGIQAMTTRAVTTKLNIFGGNGGPDTQPECIGESVAP